MLAQLAATGGVSASSVELAACVRELALPPLRLRVHCRRQCQRRTLCRNGVTAPEGQQLGTLARARLVELAQLLLKVRLACARCTRLHLRLLTLARQLFLQLPQLRISHPPKCFALGEPSVGVRGSAARSLGGFEVMARCRGSIAFCGERRGPYICFAARLTCMVPAWCDERAASVVDLDLGCLEHSTQVRMREGLRLRGGTLDRGGQLATVE